MEDHPTAVGGEIVVEGALELFSFEDGSGGHGYLVEMFSYFGAFGIADGVDSNFYFIDEVKEGLEHGSRQILISDFLAHLNYNYRDHLFFFLFFLAPASFSILMISFCFFSCSEAKN